MLISRADAVMEGHVLLPVTKHFRGPARNTSAAGLSTPTPPVQLPVAVVYLDGLPSGRSEKTVRLIQRNLSFVPTVLPIQAGTRVEFVNEDAVSHSLFSYSAAKRFEFGLCGPSDSERRMEQFNVPGLVTVRCDEHEQMRGFILVLETPHFVTVNKDGTFRLSGLPSGQFTLKAWLNHKVTLERPVTLNENSHISLDFTVPESVLEH